MKLLKFITSACKIIALVMCGIVVVNASAEPKTKYFCSVESPYEETQYYHGYIVNTGKTNTMVLRDYRITDKNSRSFTAYKTKDNKGWSGVIAEKDKLYYFKCIEKTVDRG